jgi:hypothetical protein
MLSMLFLAMFGNVAGEIIQSDRKHNSRSRRIQCRSSRSRWLNRHR